MEDDFEYTLLRKNNVNLFKLPTRNILGAKGHYLNSWKNKIWVGKNEYKIYNFEIFDNLFWVKIIILSNQKIMYNLDFLIQNILCLYFILI